MTPVHWRRTETGDATTLSILGGATFLTSFAHDHPGAALIAHIGKAHGTAYYQAALADPMQTIWIGETPLGAPVGYVMLTPPDLPVPTDPACDLEVKRIYLLPGWQGGGHGDRIMELIGEEAQQRRAGRLLLAVYPQNERARRFYERHGFGQIGDMTFMVGDVPFRDLIYARTL